MCASQPSMVSWRERGERTRRREAWLPAAVGERRSSGRRGSASGTGQARRRPQVSAAALGAHLHQRALPLLHRQLADLLCLHGGTRSSTRSGYEHRTVHSWRAVSQLWLARGHARELRSTPRPAVRPGRTCCRSAAPSSSSACVAAAAAALRMHTRGGAATVSSAALGSQQQRQEARLGLLMQAYSCPMMCAAPAPHEHDRPASQQQQQQQRSAHASDRFMASRVAT